MARNEGHEGHEGPESLQRSLELRAVNYFVSLARCYWMIVALEICMRSKMKKRDGGPVESTTAKSPRFYKVLSNLSTAAFFEETKISKMSDILGV